MHVRNEHPTIKDTILESHNVITRLHCGYIVADRLDDTCTLVTQDDRERSLWILAR